jgi:hypothetical protein
MSTKATIVLAIAAGFLGGIASQRLIPARVYAQGQTPSIPREIRARSFVVVDENGIPRGAFGMYTKARPEIEITDIQGHARSARFYGDMGHARAAAPKLVPPQ